MPSACPPPQPHGEHPPPRTPALQNQSHGHTSPACSTLPQKQLHPLTEWFFGGAPPCLTIRGWQMAPEVTALLAPGRRFCGVGQRQTSSQDAEMLGSSSHTQRAHPPWASPPGLPPLHPRPVLLQRCRRTCRLPGPSGRGGRFCDLQSVGRGRGAMHRAPAPLWGEKIRQSSPGQVRRCWGSWWADWGVAQLLGPLRRHS